MADVTQTNKPIDQAPATADLDKLRAEQSAAQTKALEAQAKADDAKKSQEQKDADKARLDADKVRASIAEQESTIAMQAAEANTTVASAKIHAPVPLEMSAGDHLAQKFGNDPANPAPLPGLGSADGVKLYRITPDSPDPVTTSVHPDMVGNYLRAGWSRV